MASPMNAPMMMTRKKSPAASTNTNWLVMTAAMANRKTTNEEASFSRLSPSAILTRSRGAFTFLMMLVAEMASGGDTMPPSKNPRASVKPGINALEKMATAQEVMMTIGKAKDMITRRHL